MNYLRGTEWFWFEISAKYGYAYNSKSKIKLPNNILCKSPVQIFSQSLLSTFWYE